jgi:hypothetical protein
VKKNILIVILAVLLAFPVIALSVPVSVPSSPSAGYMLVSTTTGNYISTTTSPIHADYYFATSTMASQLPYASSTAHTLSGSLFDRLSLPGTAGQLLESTASGIQWAASTTFASPLSYSAGQVSCPTCSTGLTGGSPNTLTYWTSTSAVSATSSPTVGNVYATTTTATSTFLGGVTIGNPTTGFNVTPNGSTTIGASTGVGVLEVQGIDSLSTNGRLTQLGVYNTGTQLVDRGGVIALGGISGSAITSFAAIAGRKENATGGNTQGYLAFFTRPPSGAMTTESMRISSIRNVGIGTTTPVWPLQVASSSGPQLTLSDGGITHWSFRSSSDGFLYIATSSPINLNPMPATSTQAVVQIDKNGKVGIGTTTPAGVLSVKGTGFWSGLTSSGATQSASICLSVSNELIADSGVCIVSSERFKDNISKLSPSLEEVLKLNPVSFTYKKTGNPLFDGRGEQVGLIAEQVEKIDPRLVEYGADGKPYSVRYENLSAVLIKALQEQQQEIDGLKGEIKGLRAIIYP